LPGRPREPIHVDRVESIDVGVGIDMAHRLGATAVFNPMVENVDEKLCRAEPHGVDITLEMSGHPSALNLAVGHTRPGGHVSLLGVYPDSSERVDFNSIIFKGLTVHGIVGRKLWQTWDQMSWLLEEKHLDVTPIITHQMPYTEFDAVFQTMKEGKAGKIVLDFTNSA
jgi:threonine 3-dehydrogenase